MSNILAVPHRKSVSRFTASAGLLLIAAQQLITRRA
jgi:hypothetical protein